MAPAVEREERPVTALEARDWETLLTRVRAGKCTPFLGAGASSGELPDGAALAREWAATHKYPFEDSHDLARVSQFLAVMTDPMFPKEEICDQFRAASTPDFEREDEPHASLARLPLPLYVTTNYDNFMYEALEHAAKHPKLEICRWNKSPRLKAVPRVLDSRSVLDANAPVVFFLHGHLSVPDSLVLTEGDYLDFLVAASQDYQRVVPAPVQEALAATSLMFVGYSLADWDFRVLHRGILAGVERSLRRLSVTVQLPRRDAEQETYLERYFSDLMEVKVFWGTATEFAAELSKRWLEFEKNV
jgi:hypothetical protein